VRDQVLTAHTEEEMRRLGAELVHSFRAGDVVLLEGPLGAGKTTLVRGMLAGLGFHDAVRSPTFNLVQTFETDLPVMHADLYRVKTWQGIGLEDYLDTHLCLIEWPDRAQGLLDFELAWQINIAITPTHRQLQIHPPPSAETEALRN
jgi:tRNA threonylcarbamoyladenosine biosynthesis protein TsaE